MATPTPDEIRRAYRNPPLFVGDVAQAGNEGDRIGVRHPVTGSVIRALAVGGNVLGGSVPVAAVEGGGYIALGRATQQIGETRKGDGFQSRQSPELDPQRGIPIILIHMDFGSFSSFATFGRVDESNIPRLEQMFSSFDSIDILNGDIISSDRPERITYLNAALDNLGINYTYHDSLETMSSTRAWMVSTPRPAFSTEVISAVQSHEMPLIIVGDNQNFSDPFNQIAEALGIPFRHINVDLGDPAITIGDHPSAASTSIQVASPGGLYAIDDYDLESDQVLYYVEAINPATDEPYEHPDTGEALTQMPLTFFYQRS